MTVKGGFDYFSTVNVLTGNLEDFSLHVSV